MTVSDLERLYDYGYWANAQYLAVIAKLTSEQFTRNVAGSYGSVRNTLVHMMSAEWGWLDRCGGCPPRGPALKGDDFPTLDAIVDKWKSVEQYMRGFLGTLTDADLERAVEFMNPRGEKRAMPLGSLLRHAANHGVHHRGQIALLLRALGVAPGNVDMLFYDAEKLQAPLVW